MPDWSKWAETALVNMDDPSWECRPSDRDRAGGVQAARSALEEIRRTGHEPYYTLKAFVILNDLERRSDD